MNDRIMPAARIKGAAGGAVSVFISRIPIRVIMIPAIKNGINI